MALFSDVLLTVDYDRTMTDTNGQVPVENMEAIRYFMENGGAAYRQQAGAFRGFTLGGDPCTNLCLCYLFNLFCCGGRGFFLCC